MQTVKNIIFFSENVHIRAGGPAGYIANLKKGILEKNIDDIAFIDGSIKIHYQKRAKKIAKVLTCLIPFKKLRRKARFNLEQKILGKPLDHWGNCSLTSPNYKIFIKELDKYHFDSITCHWVKDAVFIRNYLSARKSSASLILMSHSPQPPSQEVYEAETAAKIPLAKKNYQIWKQIEKEAFCKSCDCLLFPSKEAMEPYLFSLSYFPQLVKTKKLFFMATGCESLNCSKDKQELRKKFGITTPYIITYIGRHNIIKGYDLLQKIAQKILYKRNDVTFLIGGKLSDEIKPLKNDKWIELGIVNPAELFKIADCFILPNRQTYFDLICLEALSMGCPIFASNTGGNKSVYYQTKVISLYTKIDECVKQVNSFLDLSNQEKNKLRQKVFEAYNTYYTLDVFSKNYLNLIKGIMK